jgi:hypothetical protein
MILELMRDATYRPAPGIRRHRRILIPIRSPSGDLPQDPAAHRPQLALSIISVAEGAHPIGGQKVYADGRG